MLYPEDCVVKRLSNYKFAWLRPWRQRTWIINEAPRAIRPARDESLLEVKGRLLVTAEDRSAAHVAPCQWDEPRYSLRPSNALGSFQRLINTLSLHRCISN